MVRIAAIDARRQVFVMSDKLRTLDLLELEQIDQSIFVLAIRPVEQTLFGTDGSSAYGGPADGGARALYSFFAWLLSATRNAESAGNNPC